MSPHKEANFFLFEDGEFDYDFPNKQHLLDSSMTTFGAYSQLFSQASDEEIIGESSPLYLVSPGSPARIYNFNERIKLLAVLRNPVDRFYSHYLQLARHIPVLLHSIDDVVENKSIPGMLGLFDYFIELGLYDRQIKRFMDVFSFDQMKVLLYEDLLANQQCFYRNVCNFLGVDEGYMPDLNLKYNSSGVPKSILIEKVVQGLKPAKRLAKRVLPKFMINRLAILRNRLEDKNLELPPRLGYKTRKELFDTYYKESVERLQVFISRDLTDWMPA
jgi:hypothetical protein